MEVITPEQVHILRDAIQLWGTAYQLSLAQEEFAELITKISHYRRGRIEAERVVEEMADAQIMLWQMMEIPALSQGVRMAIVDKLTRLEIRIDNTIRNEQKEAEEKYEKR